MAPVWEPRIHLQKHMHTHSGAFMPPSCRWMTVLWVWTLAQCAGPGEPLPPLCTTTTNTKWSTCLGRIALGRKGGGSNHLIRNMLLWISLMNMQILFALWLFWWGGFDACRFSTTLSFTYSRGVSHTRSHLAAAQHGHSLFGGALWELSRVNCLAQGHSSHQYWQREEC